LRREREKERERELRLEAKDHAGGRRSKITRDRDRDVSEKIALGQADVGHAAEVQYDSRLFNRDKGLAAGFGGDDSYNFYDKELFADRSAMGLYRANARDADVYGGAEDTDRQPMTKRFRPDRGFEGSDAAGTGPRTGPVQFDAKHQEEADPFGIESFLGGVAKK
jgi:SNW domain-containing protein 1